MTASIRDATSTIIPQREEARHITSITQRVRNATSRRSDRLIHGRSVRPADAMTADTDGGALRFLTALERRGLSAVRLVISDQHAGLVAALKRSFQGTGHQR